jgi:hypothetical protein
MLSKKGAMGLGATVFYGVILFGVLVGVSGCFFVEFWVPDQEGYEPISKLSTSGEAVARVYATPIPPLGLLVVHTYLVVKPADSTVFDRWDCWSNYAEPNGHLRKNLYDSEDDFGWGPSYIVAELIGPSAEGVVEFVANHSLDYPYREIYHYIPGPNCNTYPQWVLDSTGWSVELPSSAIGKEFGKTVESRQ